MKIRHPGTASEPETAPVIENTPAEAGVSPAAEEESPAVAPCTEEGAAIEPAAEEFPDEDAPVAEEPPAEDVPAAEEMQPEAEQTEKVPAEDASAGEEPLLFSEDASDFFDPEALFGKEQRKKKHKLLIVLLSVVLVIAVAALGGVLYLKHLKKNPASQFQTVQATAAPVSETATPEPEKATPSADDGEPEETATPEPGATDTPDPYTSLMEQADLSMMENIVNVALIGVDYADERQTGYSGKARDNAFHADVVIILAINFDANRVDMISIPRDTYTKMPGVKGIYKFNASLDCGGGLYAKGGAGFEKVCEAAEWMLGGIPVDYYYAVTMPAVKQLGDAVGGVDFDLDIDFKIQGRSYKKGMQHMDGQAILDYLRVRKNIAESGDNNRVKRQKKMLIALFESMQNQNLILKIPEILSAFDGQLFTNTNLSQTTALALFAYGLDSNNIGMYSMGSGSSGTSGVTNIFGWNFCITDQNNRVELIKKIYGVDVPVYREYTRTYANYRWNSMLADQYLRTTQGLTTYVNKVLREDDLLPTASPSPSPTPTPTPTPESTPTAGPTDTPTAKPTESTEPTHSSDPEPTHTSEPEPTNSSNPEPTHTSEPEPTHTSEPEPTHSSEPVQEPEPKPEQNEGGSSAEQTAVRRSAGMTVTRLSARRNPIARDNVETRKYTDEQRALFREYKEALTSLENAMNNADTQAAKYAKGNKNSLASANERLSNAMSSVKSLAQQVASEFGYSKGFNWEYHYWTDKSFNEVIVNFN